MRVLNIMIIMLVLIMSVGAVCATDSISDDITSDGNQEKLETTQDNLIVMGGKLTIILSIK